MIQEETKNYIDDQVRLATDSSLKAISQVLGYLQNSNKEIREVLDRHKIEEEVSREKARQEMREAVKEQIQITVNGKIDKIAQTLEEMKDMKKDYDDGQGFNRVVKKGILYVLGLAGLIGAWATIKSTIE